MFSRIFGIADENISSQVPQLTVFPRGAGNLTWLVYGKTSNHLTESFHDWGRGFTSHLREKFWDFSGFGMAPGNSFLWYRNRYWKKLVLEKKSRNRYRNNLVPELIFGKNCEAASSCVAKLTSPKLPNNNLVCNEKFINLSKIQTPGVELRFWPRQG